MVGTLNSGGVSSLVGRFFDLVVLRRSEIDEVVSIFSFLLFGSLLNLGGASFCDGLRDNCLRISNWCGSASFLALAELFSDGVHGLFDFRCFLSIS